MYQLLLTRRYLASKIMPLLASMAVALCVAMVLIVWSVMGGFLTMLINSGRGLVGDVSISWPATGFAYYDDLIQRLEADPMVEAATPMIETFGQVALPDGRTESAMIVGIDGPSFARVTNYADSLWWKPLDQPLPKDEKREDIRLNSPLVMKKLYEDGLVLKELEIDEQSRRQPGTGRGSVLRSAAVPGIEFTGANQRSESGVYVPYQLRARNGAGGLTDVSSVMLAVDGSITVSVLPMDSTGLKVIDAVTRRFPIANEFRSGIYEFDSNRVYIDLSAVQEMLRMDEARRLGERVPGQPGAFSATRNPDGTESFSMPPVIEIDPARVTTVLVRGRFDESVRAGTGSQAAEELKARVREIYAQFAAAHAGKVPEAYNIQIQTWRDQNRTMINAVEKETGLVLFLFIIISFVSVFLVLAIFWAMVSEKTRDIGILRSIGASRVGIASLWLVYGLAIGIVGSIAGGLMAFAVVSNINVIHEWLGHVTGMYIWDPRVYYFTEIPTDMSTPKVLIVLVTGVISAALGALWPAVRAALMHPVRALRFE